MTDVSAPVTIAALRVQNGKLVSSTSGVAYDAATGIVIFPNPKGLVHIIPIVSNTANANNDYLTTTNFIREISPPNQFRVWCTPLDTGNRNFAPHDFTAVVVGFT